MHHIPHGYAHKYCKYNASEPKPREHRKFRNSMSYTDSKRIDRRSRKTCNNAHIYHSAANQSVIPQRHCNSHKHRDKSKSFFGHTESGSAQAENQHKQRNNKHLMAVKLSQHRADRSIECAAFHLHIHKSICEEDEENNAGGINHCLLYQRQKSKRPHRISFYFVIRARYNQCSSRCFVYNSVKFTCRNNPCQDSHNYNDNSQNNISMRDFKRFLLFLFHFLFLP